MAHLYHPCSTFDFAAKNVSVSKEVSSPRARRIRLAIITSFAVMWVALVLWRLVSLQITENTSWQEWALKQHFAEVELASERGPIYDRHDRLLAVSVPAGSVYVRPRLIENRAQTSKLLAGILGVSSSKVEERLSSPKPFVWVKRQIPRATAEKVADLKIPGVGFVLESRRYYPYNQAASALLGKVGIDGTGLSGVEALYERHLHGEQVSTRATRDALGNLIQNTSLQGESFQPPRGDSLKLTIDAGFQMILDEELAVGRNEANAKGVMGVLVDAQSGEILAMGQAPGYNFNRESISSKQDLKNLIVESVFEPGSIMKPLVAAAALEEGVIGANDMINCEGGRFPFARHVIKDVHPNNVISFRDVIIRSSNIGMTKIGLKLGKDRLYKYLTGFGFGETSELGLAGDTPGILRPESRWALVDVATHSFGQGVAVTPLQMVRAMSAIASGGVLPQLKIVAGGKNTGARRILAPATARTMQEIMYGVVEDPHGTGKKAMIEGVKVGGKTGTAQKARTHGRGYQSGSYVASFVGFVDASSLGVPRVLTLLIAVDEPHAATIYGGTLAAPVFQRVMQRVLYQLATEYEIKPRPKIEAAPALVSPEEPASPARLARVIAVSHPSA